MIAALVGADIPRALVRACGLTPRNIGPGEVPEALADPGVCCVVFSHLSAQYAQAYHRWHAAAPVREGAPELILLDLPVTDTPATRTYGLTRLHEAGRRLAACAGREIDDQTLVAAIRAEYADLPRRPEETVEAVVVGGEAMPDVAARLASAGIRSYALEGSVGYAAPEAVPPLPTEAFDPWKTLLDQHLCRARTSTRSSMTARARALLEMARARRADRIIFFNESLDAAQAWLRAAVSQQNTDDDVEVVTLTGSQAARPTPTHPGEAELQRTSTTTANHAAGNQRSQKALQVVSGFGAYQREWFAGIQRRAAAGEPFAVVNADTPQELLRALDVPFVINQWWASIVAAKQATPRFKQALLQHGYPPDHETYNSQGLAALLVPDHEAPWGGLPRPDMLQVVRSEDALMGIFEQWAAASDAELITFDRTTEARASFPVDWWHRMPSQWDEVLEPARLDLMVEQLHESTATIEQRTRRRLETDRLLSVLNLVNEQEEYYRRTRNLIAATIPAPVSIVDTMPATMIPQWHRGTTWGRDAARRLYEEVAQRVRDGAAVCPHERVRLMWVGRGTWQSMRLYQAFQQTHGAVFVWSMYLGLAADGYLRYFDRGRDPMRSLAARFVTMGDELRMPTWSASWHVTEAERHHVDAVVAIGDAEPHVLDELERTGRPVLRLSADNLSLGDDGRAEQQISDFLDTHFDRIA